MSDYKYATDEEDDSSLPFTNAKDAMLARLQPLVSKKAQKAYLGVLLFGTTALFMVGVSIVAYLVFYYKFIPQIELQRPVHLQFGDGHPWGSTALGSELVTLQPYDVTVKLDLPRTPSNLATGNFMLDLSLSSELPSSSRLSKTPIGGLISQSRRPAIMTYVSPLIDTVSKLTFMPLYLTGWNREAEALEVRMMERIEFPRGWRNLPQSLRLEIHSEERMQVYNAQVHFKAALTGLRWFVYNWRITSFVLFGFLFWFVSMLSTSIVWITLAYLFSGKSKAKEGKAIKRETQDDASIKDEDEDEDSGDLSRVPPETTKTENDTEEESPRSNPASASETEDASNTRHTRHGGMGTGVESAGEQGVQRRRSRMFESGHS